MYIFLFSHQMANDYGHEFKQIIADSEREARAVFDLDQFWQLKTQFKLKDLYDAEITWEFEYFSSENS